MDRRLIAITLAIPLLVAIAAFGAVRYFSFSTASTNEEAPAETQYLGESDTPLEAYTSLGSQVIDFEGTVLSISRACESDGDCSVTLQDGKVITTGGGRTAHPADNVWGVALLDMLQPGTPAKIRAVRIDDQKYTLQRCQDCYIRVEPPSMQLQP